ncbi:helix-turn-helix domain-containing protein [Thalassococcus profundi]|uniref:helix-turn-helix domain-containing protein n=1 Tax=Thalassococcus profundi TaxID=2282382 RepID=UPI0026A0213B
MSELLPFCKIKLQYLLEMVTDHELDDNALRVALYLALAHADHETGESRPSFETIGAAIGKHAKSVKRALNKVEAAGYMTVERGTNKGKSSRYRPSEAALKRATERRREGDKVVPLSRAKGGQSCPQSGTDLSGKGGQDRPLNREQELRKEQGCASAPDLPDEGQSGGTRPDLVFVPRGICFVREWDARLAREGMTTLERSRGDGRLRTAGLRRAGRRAIRHALGPSQPRGPHRAALLHPAPGADHRPQPEHRAAGLSGGLRFLA